LLGLLRNFRTFCCRTRRMHFVAMPDQFPSIAKKSKVSVHVVDQRVVERLQMSNKLSWKTSLFSFSSERNYDHRVWAIANLMSVFWKLTNKAMQD
jgi:hypothetical protein